MEVTLNGYYIVINANGGVENIKWILHPDFCHIGAAIRALFGEEN